MATLVQERFVLLAMAANASAIVGTQIGGFLATVSGTLTVTDANGSVIVNAVPVTAGVFTPLPFLLPTAKNTVQLAGGAAGTLAI